MARVLLIDTLPDHMDYLRTLRKQCYRAAHKPEWPGILAELNFAELSVQDALDNSRRLIEKAG